MKTSKFFNNDMALMAASAAFVAAAHSGHYVVLSGGQEVGQYTIDVHLETNEQFTLPSGYVYSEEKEKTYSSPMMERPSFKNKKYYFYF